MLFLRKYVVANNGSPIAIPSLESLFIKKTHLSVAINIYKHAYI